MSFQWEPEVLGVFALTGNKCGFWRKEKPSPLLSISQMKIMTFSVFGLFFLLYLMLWGVFGVCLHGVARYVRNLLVSGM